MTFDMKVRFDTGRKFAISVGSRPDLLSRGVTIAMVMCGGIVSNQIKKDFIAESASEKF